MLHSASGRFGNYSDLHLENRCRQMNVVGSKEYCVSAPEDRFTYGRCALARLSQLDGRARQVLLRLLSYRLWLCPLAPVGLVRLHAVVTYGASCRQILLGCYWPALGLACQRTLCWKPAQQCCRFSQAPDRS